MASKVILLLVVVVVIVAPASAVDYVVGDEAGWKLLVNYTAWTEGKNFYVGDTIIFEYRAETYDVYEVMNETAFEECSVPASGSLTSGNDSIILATPGMKWYICGVNYGVHCEVGLRLVITVFSAPALAPALPPVYEAPIMVKNSKKGFWSNWKLKFH